MDKGDGTNQIGLLLNADRMARRCPSWRPKRAPRVETSPMAAPPTLIDSTPSECYSQCALPAPSFIRHTDQEVGISQPLPQRPKHRLLMKPNVGFLRPTTVGTQAPQTITADARWVRWCAGRRTVYRLQTKSSVNQSLTPHNTNEEMVESSAEEGDNTILPQATLPHKDGSHLGGRAVSYGTGAHPCLTTSLGCQCSNNQPAQRPWRWNRMKHCQ